MGMESGNHVTIFIPLILLTIYTGWNSQTIIVTEQQGHKKTQNGNGKWKSCHYFHTVNINDHIHSKCSSISFNSATFYNLIITRIYLNLPYTGVIIAVLIMHLTN